jgi:Tyrosine phosphatase family
VCVNSVDGCHLPSHHFVTLCRLGLQTIVSIVPQPPLQDLIDFCEQQHIVLLPITAEKYKEEGMPVTSAQVAQVKQYFIFMLLVTACSDMPSRLHL